MVFFGFREVRAADRQAGAESIHGIVERLLGFGVLTWSAFRGRAERQEWRTRACSLGFLARLGPGGEAAPARAQSELKRVAASVGDVPRLTHLDGDGC